MAPSDLDRLISEYRLIILRPPDWGDPTAPGIALYINVYTPHFVSNYCFPPQDHSGARKITPGENISTVFGIQFIFISQRSFHFRAQCNGSSNRFFFSCKLSARLFLGVPALYRVPYNARGNTCSGTSFSYFVFQGCSRVTARPAGREVFKYSRVGSEAIRNLTGRAEASGSGGLETIHRPGRFGSDQKVLEI